MKSENIEKKYIVDLRVGGQAGDTVETSVTLRERPFTLAYITHQIIDDGNAPNPLVQHGLYSIDWSIQNDTRFWQGDSVPMADAAYGSIRTGNWIPFIKPIGLEAKTTIYVALMNRRTQPNEYTVQAIFHGLEKVNNVG